MLQCVPNRIVCKTCGLVFHMCLHTYADQNMHEICTHTHMQLELCNKIQLYARIYRTGTNYTRNMHKNAYYASQIYNMCITSLNMPKMCKLTICTYMQENHMHKYSQICIFKKKKAQTCVFKMCILCTYMCYMIEHSRRKICHSMQIKICKNLN